MNRDSEEKGATSSDTLPEGAAEVCTVALALAVALALS